MKLFSISLVILGIVLFWACGNLSQNESRVDKLPYFKETTFTPQWLDRNSAILNNFHKISSFNLVNQLGESVTEKTFEDKIYVTDFFFTICPGICPKMMDNMGILHDEFIDDQEVLLISHSVTPERDSVPVLFEYANDRAISASKWHLVTGERKQIYKLGREDYFIEENLGLEVEKDDFLHTENFVLIDKNKHIRGIYNGLNKTSIQQLIADIKTLKKNG